MGTEWRFLDPSNTYSDTAHLRWALEGQPAVIPDEHALTVGKTAFAPPEWTARRRSASLTLTEDGTLEGDVRVEYTGHLDIQMKEQDDHLADAERVKKMTDSVTRHLQGAEVTEVAITNVTQPGSPYTTAYHLRVPGYAEKTGSRIFFQPAVFEKGVEPEFPAQRRSQPIFFDYAWHERDDITIALPAGYDLELPDRPGDIEFDRIGAYRITLTRAVDGSKVQLVRDFFFGGDQKLWFPVEAYPMIKRFFDEVSKSDGHALTLHKTATTERPHS